MEVVFDLAYTVFATMAESVAYFLIEIDGMVSEKKLPSRKIFKCQIQISSFAPSKLEQKYKDENVP